MITNSYRVEFTHSAPITIKYAHSRAYAIDKAISQLRDWEGKTTKTQKRKCIVSCKIIK